MPLMIMARFSAAASILAYKVVGSPWHVSLGALAGVALAVILPPRHSGVGVGPANMEIEKLP